MVSKTNVDSYYKNALNLAYLGDSVFSLMVREYLVKNRDAKPNALNKLANSVVCAKAQAEFMQKIKDSLEKDELDIVLRARNAHLNNKAKNSSLQEYSLATQFEAVVGYWYLNQNKEKLDNMFDLVKEKLC